MNITLIPMPKRFKDGVALVKTLTINFNRLTDAINELTAKVEDLQDQIDANHP